MPSPAKASGRQPLPAKQAQHDPINVSALLLVPSRRSSRLATRGSAGTKDPRCEGSLGPHAALSILDEATATTSQHQHPPQSNAPQLPSDTHHQRVHIPAAEASPPPAAVSASGGTAHASNGAVNEADGGDGGSDGSDDSRAGDFQHSMRTYKRKGGNRWKRTGKCRGSVRITQGLHRAKRRTDHRAQ